MKILKECNLAQLVVEVLDGQTIVFPTETSCGLGCDATNQTAVDKIFKIKGRDYRKPLLVVVPSVAMAKKYLVWNELLEQIAEKYWPPYAKVSEGKPGAVTVVGKYAGGGGLAHGVVSKDNTLALRVTAYPLLKSITEKIQRPMVATSANIAGAGEVYSAREIAEIFQNKKFQPDIILDYGELPRVLPTTLVSVVGDKLKILRQGEIYVDLA